MKQTKVIAGFPGVGKSVLFTISDLTISDSDSSKFSWLAPGVRNPDFIEHYTEYIKKQIGEVDYILVSSHNNVRHALQENGIEYTLVYPDIELKQEYLQRYKKRGNDDAFLSMIDSNWETFIKQIEQETFPRLIKLGSKQYLADVLETIARGDVANIVTEEQVNRILSEARITTETLEGRITVVKAFLKSGFAIIKYSGAVDPANYSEEIGKKECMREIKNDIWRYEGYKLADKLSN